MSECCCRLSLQLLQCSSGKLLLHRLHQSTARSVSREPLALRGMMARTRASVRKRFGTVALASTSAVVERGWSAGSMNVVFKAVEIGCTGGGAAGRGMTDVEGASGAWVGATWLRA